MICFGDLWEVGWREVRLVVGGVGRNGERLVEGWFCSGGF